MLLVVFSFFFKQVSFKNDCPVFFKNVILQNLAKLLIQ
ncbi:hypothetical Protein psc5_05390 [Candidatus Phytoplasma solani]